MFYRLKRKWNETIFNYRCRGILDSACIPNDENAPYLVTLLHKAAVVPYLVAVKSFWRCFGAMDYVILNDGSLDVAAINLLKKHLSNVRVVPLEEAADKRLQSGGCWERLALLARLSQDKYTIQLDSDTICFEELHDVKAIVAKNQAFTLGGHAKAAVKRCAEYKEKWQNNTPIHIQSLCEVEMLKHSTRWPFYVQGCAAFVGIPRGTVKLEGVVELSQAFGNSIGGKWYDWGSEQFASNLIVANIENAQTLPFPAYSSYAIEYVDQLKASRFLHFYGTCRYHNGRYVESASEVTRQILRGLPCL